MSKHEIVNILITVRQKLPHSLSQSIAKHQLTSQKQCTFVTVQPHTLLGFGHTKHYTVLPAYTKLQEWPMHDGTKHYHKLQNHVYMWHINLWDSVHILTKELFIVLLNTPQYFSDTQSRNNFQTKIQVTIHNLHKHTAHEITTYSSCWQMHLYKVDRIYGNSFLQDSAW